MPKRMIYCGYCGKEHQEDSAILAAHQRLLGSGPHTYGAPSIKSVGMSKEERKQLANSLHNYVEKAYANNQRQREFYDHLIETYREKGQEAIDELDWQAFRELLDEAL